MLRVANRHQIWHQCTHYFRASNTTIMANSFGHAYAWLTWSSGTIPASIWARIGTLHQHRAVPESNQISSCLILCLLYAPSLAPTTDWEPEKGQRGCLAEALLPCSSYTCHVCKVQLICLVCFTLSFKECARALSLSLKHLKDNLYHTMYWTNNWIEHTHCRYSCSV